MRASAHAFFLALFFGALASLIWFPLALVVFFVALLALIPVRGTCRYLREDRQTASRELSGDRGALALNEG